MKKQHGGWRGRSKNSILSEQKCRFKFKSRVSVIFQSYFIATSTLTMTTLLQKHPRSEEEEEQKQERPKKISKTDKAAILKQESDQLSSDKLQCEAYRPKEAILKNVLIQCVTDRDYTPQKHPWPIRGIYQKEVDDLYANRKETELLDITSYYEDRKDDYTIGDLVKLEVEAIVDKNMVQKWTKDKSGLCAAVKFTFIIPEINGGEPVVFDEGYATYDPTNDKEEIISGEFSQVKVQNHTFTFDLNYKYQYPEIEALAKKLFLESKLKQNL